MENSSEKSSGSLPYPALVALFFTVLGIVIPPLTPLESARPSATSAHFLYQDIEDVDARLWQYPFSAVTQ
jgi:hypothetical protein